MLPDWQPRFAAFAASFGRTDEAFNCTARRVDFFGFIARCRQSAPAGVVINGNVIDHAAFTAHCWNVARDDLLQRFSA